MNQETKDQLQAEYEECIFNVETAKGRKQAVYWAHRATELKQVMDSRNAYKYEYSGIC